MKIKFTIGLLILSAIFISTGHAQIIKSDTATMNTAADWSGTPPDATTVGQFDTTISAPNEAALTLGGNVSLLGLLFGTMNGPVTVGGGNTLTLGTSGIDMSAANQNVTLNCGLTLASGLQSWKVISGQTLTVGGTFTHTGAIVDFTGFAGALGALGNVNGILGPWSQTGSGASMQYATVSGGVVSGYTGTAAANATAVTDTTGTVNYDVSGVGALGAGASFNTLRYVGPITTGVISGNFTANGLMNVTPINTLTFSGGITIGSSGELVINTATGTTSPFTFTGPFTGNSASIITIIIPSATAIVNFGGTGAGTQFANFSGTLKLGNSIGSIKFRNDTVAATDKGLSNAVVDLGTGSAQIVNKSATGSGANSGSPTQSIGALIGGVNTILDAGDASAGSALIYTYKVGSLNTGAEFDGVIRNTSGHGTTAIIKTGTGTWTVPHANTYVGKTTISGGTLSTGAGGTLANGGTASSIGQSANAAANLVLDGGTLQYASTGTATSSDRLFTLTQNGGGVDASGANTLTLAGNGANAVTFTGNGARTLTLTGANTGANTFAPILGDGAGGATSLIKSGSGQWVLTGANTYSGNTTISNGTLVLGSTASILNSANNTITVSNGATFDVSAVSFTLGGSQTLFGGGTINGSVNTASGTKIYAGADGGYGTNTINNNLTLATGALLYFDVGTVHNGSNDLIAVGGSLTLSNTTFHVKAPSTLVSLDTSADYVLMTAGNIASGSTVATSPVWDVAPVNAANFSVVISGNTIALHFTSSTPPSGTGAASPSPIARGQTTKLTVSATPGSNPTISSVVVDASLIGGSSSVSLVRSNLSNIFTNTVTVGGGAVTGNQSLPVTITDGASHTGTTSISVTVVPASQVWGGGSLSDDNWTDAANWLSGVAPQNGDSVTFGGTTRLTPNLDNSYSLGSLTFNNTAASFVIGTANSSALTLTGGLTNNSANAQTLNVPVNLNTTQALNAAAGNVTLGGVVSGTVGLTKSGNNSLILSGVNNYVGDTTISNGNLQINDPGQLNIGSYAGNIADNGAFTYNSTAAQTLSGTISGTGTLTNSAGTLTLGGANTYSGGTTISSSGILVLSSASAAGTGNINLLSGGTLQPNAAVTYTNALTVNGSGTVAVAASGTSASLTGPVTGSGTMNLNITGTTTILNFGGTNAGTQFAGFSGTVELGSSVGVLKFRNDSGPLTDKNLGNAILDLGTGSAILESKATAGTGANSGSVTQTIGALAGGVNTVVDGGDTAGIAATYTYNVGGLNNNAQFDGLIRNNHGTVAIIKSGTGTWTLTHANTYIGNTTISNGVLALAFNGAADGSIASSPIINVLSGAILDVSARSDGTFPLGASQQLRGRGTINGNLDTTAGGMVAPGGGTGGNTGTITVTNVATLGGTAWMKLNRTNSPNSDVLVASNSITYGGTLVVTNIGGALQPGDTFKLFSSPIYNSSFGTIVLPNYYTWNTSQLAVNGTIQVTSASKPAISSVDFTTLGSGFITLNATNGVAGGTLIVLTSTNLTVPLGNWTPVITNTFDGSGNLTGQSVPVPASQAQQFFLIEAF